MYRANRLPDCGLWRKSCLWLGGARPMPEFRFHSVVIPDNVTAPGLVTRKLATILFSKDRSLSRYVHRSTDKIVRRCT
jgi:hypothetical protein